jgi:hypothetical protein
MSHYKGVKHMFPRILQALLFLPIKILFTTSAYPLVPIAILFVNKDGRLPWIFKWLETHDNPGWSGPLSEKDTREKTEKYGQKIGLMFWLWRNRANRATSILSADIYEIDRRYESGTWNQNIKGFSCWYGCINGYFELQPSYGFTSTRIYVRIGWKMKPYFNPNMTEWPKLGSGSNGMYTGITPRSDGLN